MNKAELIDTMAKKTKISKKNSEAFLNTFMDTVKGNLKKGNKVVLVGFGTFLTYKRKATSGVNPKTKQTINIPEKKVAKLKWSDLINQSLNK